MHLGQGVEARPDLAQALHLDGRSGSAAQCGLARQPRRAQCPPRSPGLLQRAEMLAHQQLGNGHVSHQVAGEVVDAYRDGVWLAELGSIRDPALVSTTVAQLLGLVEAVHRRLPGRR